MTVVKLFQDSSINFLERNINEYLNYDDEENLININITTAKKENRFPSTDFIAIVITKFNPSQMST